MFQFVGRGNFADLFGAYIVITGILKGLVVGEVFASFSRLNDLKANIAI